jgi:hypothetical protein
MLFKMLLLLPIRVLLEVTTRFVEILTGGSQSELILEPVVDHIGSEMMVKNSRGFRVDVHGRILSGTMLVLASVVQLASMVTQLLLRCRAKISCPKAAIINSCGRLARGGKKRRNFHSIKDLKGETITPKTRLSEKSAQK